MSQELHYTSVPRGLKPGSRGFGTVAATAGLPEALADRLEALSAYQAVYPPGDPSAPLNPVAYVHVRLTVGAHAQDVLSRIGPAGLDYSGRPNKYAHHVILDPEERPEGGPAWLLSQPGFVREAWEGEPRILAEGTRVPRGDRPPGIARAWGERTGDPGWAGMLAESYLADPRRPVFLVFRPGVDLLPLFVEAIALLPASRRWDVEFSTYLTTLPPGVSCTWRGVLEGSPQAKGARRLPNALVLDLTRPAGRAQGGGLVHLARTGERLEEAETAGVVFATPPHHPARPPAVLAGPPPRPRAQGTSRTIEAAAGPDWLPDLTARLAEDASLLGGDRLPRRSDHGALRIAGILAAFVLVAIGIVLLSPALRRRLGLGPSGGAVAAEARTAPPLARSNGPAPDVTPPGPPARRTEAAKGSESAPGPVAEAKAAPKPEAKPAAPAPRAPAPPLVLAFATPDVPRSALSAPAGRDRAIRLPEDVDDRLELLNGPDLRLSPVPSPPQAREIATKTGSGLGGGSALARLSPADPRTWRFEWARGAKPRSASVEELKDAVLGLRGRDGRPIYVLLRGVEPDSESPLVVWKDQIILFEKLEPRIRPVAWAGDPDPLEGSRWKVRIRRWRAVLTRSGSDGGDDPPRRAIEPDPSAAAKAPGEGPALESDLVPGEVKFRLTLDPSRPGEVDVRIEPDPPKVRAGRLARAARREELRSATPKKDGSDQDPLEYRRARLRKLRGDVGKHGDEIKKLEGEVAELEKIGEIRRTEDLLTHPARLELSVAIGLDVEGPGILEIARIGTFAGGR